MKITENLAELDRQFDNRRLSIAKPSSLVVVLIFVVIVIVLVVVVVVLVVVLAGLKISLKVR